MHWNQSTIDPGKLIEEVFSRLRNLLEQWRSLAKQSSYVAQETIIIVGKLTLFNEADWLDQWKEFPSLRDKVLIRLLTELDTNIQLLQYHLVIFQRLEKEIYELNFLIDPIEGKLNYAVEPEVFEIICSSENCLRQMREIYVNELLLKREILQNIITHFDPEIIAKLVTIWHVPLY